VAQAASSAILSLLPGGLAWGVAFEATVPSFRACSMALQSQHPFQVQQRAASRAHLTQLSCGRQGKVRVDSQRRLHAGSAWRPSQVYRGDVPPTSRSVATVVAAVAGLTVAVHHRRRPWQAAVPQVVHQSPSLHTLLRSANGGRSKLVCRSMGSSQGSPQQEQWLNSQTGPVVLLVLAFLYGANVPLLKLISNETPLDVTGPEVLALRFITASVVCLPWIVSNWQKVKEVLLPGCELALWLWLGYTLQVFGLDKTSAALSAISIALVGVTVQCLEVFVEKAPLRPVVVASSVGVLAGLALFATAPVVNPAEGEPVRLLIERIKYLSFWTELVAQKPLPHEVLLKDVPGEVLELLGAVFFGVHVWRCNRIVSTADEKAAGGDFELALALVQLVITTILCVTFGWLDSPFNTETQVNSVERLGLLVWLQIAACGIVCTGLPAVAELFAFKVVSPEVASLIYCTIPLWSTCMSILILKEPFGPQSIAGGLTILVSSLAPSAIGLLTGDSSEEEDAADGGLAPEE